MKLSAFRPKRYKIRIPFVGEVEFEPNDQDRQAAWSLYVELQTRIAVQPFRRDSGLLREVLSSLYALFAFTREILRQAGPDVARTPDSFGPLAIKVLTVGIAPFTTKWHQKLMQHELRRPEGVTPFEHERQWQDFDAAVAELEVLQAEMKRYADALLRIAGLSGAKKADQPSGGATVVRPMAVTVLAGLAFLNALAACAAGVATLAGWRALFVPEGLGPNRIAPAALLGPFAAATGWVLCGLGVAFAAMGYGLLRLSPWVRIALLLLFGCVGAATAMATAWGVVHGETGVIAGGLLKLAAIGALVWYLNTPRLRAMFAGSGRPGTA